MKCEFYLITTNNMTQEIAEYVPLLNHDDYVIMNQYPFTIRKKSNYKKVKDSFQSYGYMSVWIDGKNYLKHRLIADQFLPNPNNLPEVDHINHDRSDNHIENLRWVSHTDNIKNRASMKRIMYEFVDDIPDESIKVLDYGKHNFDDYYFYDDVFYFYNGINYRILHINEFKNGLKFVHMTNTNGKCVSVCYNKFKKIYHLD